MIRFALPPSCVSWPRSPKLRDFSASRFRPAARFPQLKGAIWYPCAKSPGEMKMGPYLLTATEDCPIEGGKLPLVVM
jgi:hypothetical protein